MSRGNQRERYGTLEFDGASSGNPGKSGAGAVLRSGNEVHRFSQGLGTQTNNSAEYKGLILGMKEASNKGIDHLEIRGDSKLVCEQFAGKWKVNNPNLRELRNEALDLKGNFKSVTVQHVPRGSNRDADAQASRGKNLQPGHVEEDYYYN
ncbi:uncharacterized protein LOC131647279 isoform X2 [Vicia villosa]|uniref:uncharacterized protein LOC131647279 isoform X2 n=1 Tax=Vicia villosa TaxID=3911 RepID=UPI00273AF30F|nr:uncharacterized protein LOC131647279 isoform X2 [Vicia villosa]